MSLYPSLEDMKVDQMGRAQAQAFEAIAQQQSAYPSLAGPGVQSSPSHSYPDLADFMGLELSQEIIAANMPEYLNRAVVPVENRGVAGVSNMVAPLSGNSVGLVRAQVTHGVRELILCKDQKGKVGLRVQAINKGIFVCVVVKDSPAALGGLRFGDQILQVNGTTVAGYSVDDVHKLLKKSPENNISIAVRDRPFERTITVHKDSTNHIGFQYKDGKITVGFYL
jgi:syntenin-1